MLRELVELLGLATATAGAFMLWGPVALVVAGVLTLAVLEGQDRGNSP